MNMKDGINMELPASRKTGAALAFLLRALGCGCLFIMGCWGLSAIIAALAQLVQAL